MLNPSQEQLTHWNKALVDMPPQEIIQWSLLTFPGLFQTTAFGLSGLCILDMMVKSELPKSLTSDKFPVDLVFIDTLYHFPQTLELVDKVRNRYPQLKLYIYKPAGCDVEKDFQTKYGDELWEKDQLKYDYLAKVEPLGRAYKDLGIQAVFTGRRRSQGASRAHLPVVEVDEAGVVKINPLVNWGFKDVDEYRKEHNLPYNSLLDLGYKSVGDWHSTSPVKEGEDERSGRWKGQAKTECGIHQVGKYKQLAAQQG